MKGWIGKSDLQLRQTIVIKPFKVLN